MLVASRTGTVFACISAMKRSIWVVTCFRACSTREDCDDVGREQCASYARRWNIFHHPSSVWCFAGICRSFNAKPLLMSCAFILRFFKAWILKITTTCLGVIIQSDLNSECILVSEALDCYDSYVLYETLQTTNCTKLSPFLHRCDLMLAWLNLIDLKWSIIKTDPAPL